MAPGSIIAFQCAYRQSRMLSGLNRPVGPTAENNAAMRTSLLLFARMIKSASSDSLARAIRECTENHYMPAASCYSQRAASESALGIDPLQWQQDIARHWSTVCFGSLEIETQDGQHFFRVRVFPGGLDPNQIRVELYADSIQGSGPALEVMATSAPGTDSAGEFNYSAQVSALRPGSDYTASIIPRHPRAFVPLEGAQIVWQR
jgi:starch phosphorylase